MPFLDASEILKEVVKVEGRFGDAEFREGTNAAARLLFLNEPRTFANVGALKQSLSQPTAAIFMNRQSQARVTNKLANHNAASFEDSSEQPIAYVQSVRTFKVSYKMAENNRFSYNEQLSTGLRNALMDLRSDIQGYSLAQLAADKNQSAVTATINGVTWDAPNFEYNNAAGQLNIDKQASRMKAVLRKNTYMMLLDVIAGTQMSSDLLHSAAQGTANDENLVYQFNGISMVEDETIDEGTLGANGYAYMFPSGMAALTSWNEPINRRGEYTNANDNVGLYTTISDPVLPNLRYDVHVKRAGADTAATGKTFFQDVVDEYEITAFYTYGSAFHSAANTSSVFAFKQL